jgi:hypothetical protein
VFEVKEKDISPAEAIGINPRTLTQPFDSFDCAQDRSAHPITAADG